MDCDKGFSDSYMLLNSEDVKFLDLFHILFSSDLGKRQFVDSSDAKEESFRRRWVIFLSMVVQKLLQFVSRPMAWVGSRVEMVLNILSDDTGLSIWNILRGKQGFPDQSSATFISFIGNFDRRVKLDENIKPEDGCRYDAALAMMASKAAYENGAYLKTIVEGHWKMEYLGFYDYWNDYQEKATTQAFLLRDQDTIVVSFRGTETFDSDAWCSNFDLSWYELPNIGKVHGGFMKALGLQKCAGWPSQPNKKLRAAPLAYYAIKDRLKDLLRENPRSKYIVTGHSQGGALAVLFPAVLVMHEERHLLERLDGIYTFGQPRVGDGKFGEFMGKKLEEFGVKYFRFVYCNDIVPRLPYDDKDLMFKHFGTCIYYDRNYIGQVVQEEPNKNYFSPLRAIPMMMNAGCELMRSFTIAKSKGSDYKEGWFMRVFRVIGLMIPGIPNHSPQDYVNSTRLGSPNLFLIPKKHV